MPALNERGADTKQRAAVLRRDAQDERLRRLMQEHDDPDRLATYFRAKSPEEVTSSPEDALVVDVPEASRYELRLGDRVVGFLDYRRRDGRLVLLHTEIDEECEGRGFGSRLAAEALEDIRRQGLEVTPMCPFVARYIERHPELHDLVAVRR